MFMVLLYTAIVKYMLLFAQALGQQGPMPSGRNFPQNYDPALQEEEIER
jgi:hypothetical protein